MAMILKIKADKDVHRVVLPDDNVTYEAVQNAIENVHPGGIIDVKYLDDEGDLCNLCPISFSDFLTCGDDVNGRRVFKLEVTLSQSDFTSSFQIDDASPAQTIDVDLDLAQTSSLETSSQCVLSRCRGQFQDSSKSGFRPWWCRESWRDLASSHTPTVRGMLVKLVQLRKSGFLDAQSAVALVIAHLPDLIAQAASHASLVASIVTAKASYLRPVLEDLQALAADSAHMQQCASDLQDFLSGTHSSPSVAVLSVLTSLDLLPFKEKVVFLEAFYTSQHARLEELFNLAEKWHCWVPAIPLQHTGVTCDGCHSPIHALRFKCRTCADFDFCSSCFTTRSGYHSGEFLGHQFDLIEWPHPFETLGAKAAGKGWWSGKGMGKCKAACGKGKGKGKFGKGKCLGKSGVLGGSTWHGSFGAMWHPMWHFARYADPFNAKENTWLCS